jgi:RNA polymerase sigma factor (sigma-70 family)
MTTDNINRTDRQLLTDFTARKNEQAFAELVRRHGPMVLGVCRQLLRHEQDAEDAFQATFLVLARKADSIRSPEALPNWLYGVATRLATRNRAAASRRQAREVALMDPPATEPEGQTPGAEWWPALCEEIGRLPDQYRTPFVLCYLEGKTNEEAARLLKCPTGTVFSRLARARKRLRERLARRGLVISSALLAGTLTALPSDAFAAVSPPLLRQTVRGALQFAAGRANGTTVLSPRVTRLAERQVAVPKGPPVKTIAAVLLALALGGTVAGLLFWRGAGGNRVAEGPAGGGPVAEPAAVKDPVKDAVAERLKGKWRLDAMTENGQAAPLPDNPAGRPVVGFTEDGKLTGGNAPGGFRIDSRKRPMEMDWTFGNKTTPGIFDLQDDKLTVCIAMLPNGEPAPTRPKDFEPGPGKWIMIYSRLKP